MKKSFKVSRTIRVPLGTQYDYVLFSAEIGVEYDGEEETILSDKIEIEQLQKSLDSIQRDLIERETGIVDLPMDTNKISITKRSRLKRRD
jgi:hypothetical protein